MTSRFSHHSLQRLRLLGQQPAQTKVSRGFSLGLLGSLSVVGITYAQSSTSLSWEAPAACPQRGDVLRRVQEIAGAAYAHRLGFRASGQVTFVDGNYRLLLSIAEEGSSKERSFNSKNCESLAGAAAVVLGLELKRADAVTSAGTIAGTSTASSSALPLTSGTEQAAPAATPAGGTGTPATTAASSAKTSSASTKPSQVPLIGPEQTSAPDVNPPGSRDGVFVSTYAGIATGALPKLGVPLGLSVGYRCGPLSFALAGRYDGSQQVTAVVDSDVAARLGLYSGRALLSYGWNVAAFEYSVGLTAGFGRVAARGVGSNVNSNAATQWLGFAGPTVATRFFFSNWLALSAVAGAEYAFSRPEITVEPLGTIYRFGLGQLWLTLGPEIVF